MKPVRCNRLLLAVLAFALAAPCALASAHSEDIAAARVSVNYHHPHAFTESRDAGFGHEFDHGDYMQQLRAFLVRRATPVLGPGERLSITFTNIKLAGGFEPWRGPLWSDVRFMRDVYPPRFDFTFELTGADGQVIRSGSRKLVDMAYRMNTSCGLSSTDPLCYDKGALDRWLRRGPAKW